jgi:hypothetical protein
MPKNIHQFNDSPSSKTFKQILIYILNLHYYEKRDSLVIHVNRPVFRQLCVTSAQMAVVTRTETRTSVGCEGWVRLLGCQTCFMQLVTRMKIKCGNIVLVHHAFAGSSNRYRPTTSAKSTSVLAFYVSLPSSKPVSLELLTVSLIIIQFSYFHHRYFFLPVTDYDSGLFRSEQILKQWIIYFLVRPFGWETCPSQGIYLRRTTYRERALIHIQTPNWIWKRDPRVWVGRYYMVTGYWSVCTISINVDYRYLLSIYTIRKCW